MPSFRNFVASQTSTRVWRTCKEAGRPFPKLSNDDVTDYMIMEAVTLKGLKEMREAEKEAEENAKRKDWQTNPKGFEDLRQRAEG